MNTLQQAYHDTYKTILGRNIYSQNLRRYVYTPYNGKYYSDCSSSICATMDRIGVSMSLYNTAGMYFSNIWKLVNVGSVNGHITDVTKLNVGDALMFVGNNPLRPLQIGHVESVYEINGTSERNIVLAGHGSGNPSTKNMYDYLTSRYNQYAFNGKRKGLVCVLRAIPDTPSTAPIAAVQTWLNSFTFNNIAVDNTAGNETHAAIVKVIQNALGGLALDGIFGADSRARWDGRVVEKGAVGDIVKAIQALCICRGIALTDGLDGIYGNATEAAVKTLQEQLGFTGSAVDGKFGIVTATQAL